MSASTSRCRSTSFFAELGIADEVELSDPEAMRAARRKRNAAKAATQAAVTEKE
jgi:hypothetical protein